jgi:cation diffusion facilitator family transporter
MSVSEAPTRDGRFAALVTVIIAFGANLLVAIAKTLAAVITGSASLFAEAAHSWADTGNEVFLLIAERRSGREADDGHPLGFGKEAYVGSIFAAVGLFAVGAAVGVQHGIQELLHHEPSSEFLVAYVVLALAFVLEGISFVRALRQARGMAVSRRVGTLEHVFLTSDPTLRAVFAEDAAALIGLVIAFFGVLLHQITGLVAFDAVGSILVGVLLGIVALILIDRNRRFLVGQTVPQQTYDFVRDELLAHPLIERLTYLHVEFTGPEEVFIIAAVDLSGDLPEHELAGKLRHAQQEIASHEHVAAVLLTLSAPSTG